MLRALGRAVLNPVFAAYWLRARYGRAGLMRRYERLARAAGVDRVYFVLSFDCDTEEDIEHAWPMHQRLARMGARPVYAVPCELLARGAAVYGRIRDAGGEFLNHGYREHTYFDGARREHASCFFYDQQAPDVVREDVVQAHVFLRREFGVAPAGFRTPHFGSYQKPQQLRFLHGVLKELGCQLSTSTAPLYAFRYGPLFDRFGVCEVPVSGMGSVPLTVLDTWGCFRAPGRTLGPGDYAREARLSADQVSRLGVGVLNFYADPCHICNSETFFETVRLWLSVAEPVTYSQLLERVPCAAAS